MHKSLGGRYWRDHIFAETAGKKSAESLDALSCDTVMQFNADDVESLYDNVGQFYKTGMMIDWVAFYSHREYKKTSLPNYPFEKKRYWITELVNI